MNSPLYKWARIYSQVKAVWLRETTNRLQAADYLLHVMSGGLDS